MHRSTRIVLQLGRIIRESPWLLFYGPAMTNPAPRFRLSFPRMATRRITPAYIADHIRRVLKDGGSAPHADAVQHFFKEEIKSRGWYTAELRKVAARFRRAIRKERGLDFLVQVADN